MLIVEFEYRCHECGKQLRINGLAVYEMGFGRVFCPSERAPLEEGSCAKRFVDDYIKRYKSAKKDIENRIYFFIRLKDRIIS